MKSTNSLANDEKAKKETNRKSKNSKTKNNFRRSIVNKTMIKNDIKRFWVLSLFYFMLIFFSGPFYFVMQRNRGYLTDSTYNVMQKVLQFSDAGYMVLLATILIAFIYGLCLNSFLHKRDEMVFVHSLPTTKLTNYMTSYLSLNMLTFVPIIANAALIALVKLALGFTAFSYLDIFVFMMTLIIILMVTYTTTTLISSLVGTSVAAGLGTIFVASLPLLIVASFNYLSYLFIVGGYFNNYAVEVISRYTPVVKFLSIIDQPLTLRQAIIYIIVAFEQFIIGYVLYRYRKNEKTTETLVYNVTKSVFKYLVTGLIILPFVLVFINLFDYNTYLIALGVFLALFTGYFISEMMIRKSIFVWRNYKGFVGCLLITLLVIFCCRIDITGYTRYVPEADEIESVCFGKRFAIYPGEFDNAESVTEELTSYTSDPETIKLVLDLHKVLTEKAISSVELSRRENGNAYGKDGYYSREEAIYETKTLTYVLKSGKTVKREFAYNMYDVYQELKALSENKSYKETQIYKLLNLYNEAEKTGNYDVFRLLTIETNYRGTSLEIDDPQKIKNLLAAYIEDYMNTPYEDLISRKVIGVDLQYVSNDDLASKPILVYNEGMDKYIQSYYESYLSLPAMDETYVNTINYLKEIGEYHNVFLSAQNTEYVRLYKLPLEDIASSYVDDGRLQISAFGYSDYDEVTSEIREMLDTNTPVIISDDDEIFRLTASCDEADYILQNLFSDMIDELNSGNEKLTNSSKKVKTILDRDPSKRFRYFLNIKLADGYEFIARVNSDDITIEQDETLNELNSEKFANLKKY